MHEFRMCLSSFLCVVSSFPFIIYLFPLSQHKNSKSRTEDKFEERNLDVICDNYPTWCIIYRSLFTYLFSLFEYKQSELISLPQKRQMCHATIPRTEAFCQNVRNISNGGPDHTSAFWIAKYF